MTILVTGGEGQLARALADAARGRAIARVGRPGFDFDDPATIAATLERVAPALVINAAAYTAVDKAEQDEAAAYRANRDGPGILARSCAQAAIPLIHVSTDYVFDGLKGAPYVEDDAPNPTGVYGASKLAGEQAVLDACPRAIVLRTSWVYAATGKNFVLTMLNAARKAPRLRVVGDQRGCPSAAIDLADAIWAIATRLDAGWSGSFGGVFHLAGTGETTWHGLAVAAFAEAARHGLTAPPVDAIATADWPTPARRPPDSRLDCAKLAAVFGVAMPPWRETLGRVIDTVFAEAGAARPDLTAVRA
jgi:dTDP-4-dehydrorhamnose reductase